MNKILPYPSPLPLPKPEDILENATRVINEVSKYIETAEVEGTKREIMEKIYKNKENIINFSTKIILEQIERKNKENLKKIDNTFKIVEKLIDKGDIESVEKIIISLIQSNSSYIDESSVDLIKSMLNSNLEEDTFITVEPIDE